MCIRDRPHSEGVEAGSTIATITGIAVPAMSDNKEEAWEFIKFMAGPEGAEIVADSGSIPAVKTEAVIDELAAMEGFPQDEQSREDVYKRQGLRIWTGDELILNYNKKDYHFRIAGFTQSTWLHSSVSSMVNFYMPEKAYEKLYEQQGGGYILLVRLKDQADLKGLTADFKNSTDVNIEAISMEANACLLYTSCRGNERCGDGTSWKISMRCPG